MQRNHPKPSPTPLRKWSAGPQDVFQIKVYDRNKRDQIWVLKKATLDDSAFFVLVSGQEPVYLLLGSIGFLTDTVTKKRSPNICYIYIYILIMHVSYLHIITWIIIAASNTHWILPTKLNLHPSTNQNTECSKSSFGGCPDWISSSTCLGLSYHGHVEL